MNNEFQQKDANICIYGEIYAETWVWNGISYWEPQKIDKTSFTTTRHPKNFIVKIPKNACLRISIDTRIEVVELFAKNTTIRRMVVRQDKKRTNIFQEKSRFHRWDNFHTNGMDTRANRIVAFRAHTQLSRSTRNLNASGKNGYLVFVLD